MTAFLWAWLGSTKKSIEDGGYSKFYSYVPFLNVFYFIKTSSKPIWWFILMFIPFLNFVVFSLVILDHLDRIKEFNKKKRAIIIILYPVTSRGVL